MRSQTLTVLLGNGQAFRQERLICLNEDNCPEGYGLAWTLEPLESCDVEIDPVAVAGCGDPQGVCEWTAFDVTCVLAPKTWTCAELP